MDCLKNFRERVAAEGWLPAARLDAIDAEVLELIDEAVAHRARGAAARRGRARHRRLHQLLSGSAAMPVKTMRDAINEALHLEMERDPRVIVLGEDVAGGAGGTAGQREASAASSA